MQVVTGVNADCASYNRAVDRSNGVVYAGCPAVLLVSVGVVIEADKSGFGDSRSCADAVVGEAVAGEHVRVEVVACVDDDVAGDDLGELIPVEVAEFGPFCEYDERRGIN